jgi:hypothetical protein
MIDATQRHENILGEVLPMVRQTLLDNKTRTLGKPSILVFANQVRPEVHIVEESGLRSVLRTVTPLQGRVPLRYDSRDDFLVCVVDAELVTEFRIPLPEA